jgi:hypothetical protein
MSIDTCGEKQPCGPDITDWFMQEAANHVKYGEEVRGSLSQLRLDAMTGAIIDPYLLTWRSLNPSSPFREVLDEFSEIGTSQIGGGAGTELPIIMLDVTMTSMVVGVLEYGAYGLAVDYANLSQLAHLNNAPWPQLEGTPCPGPRCQEVGGHPIMTLCDRCVDTSDLGNIMFGVGGHARGYSIHAAFGYGQLYNIGVEFSNLVQGEPFSNPFNQDPRGAFVGWTLAASGAYLNKGAFCEILKGGDLYGYRENARTLTDLTTPCSSERFSNDESNHPTPTSLYRIFGEGNERESFIGSTVETLHSFVTLSGALH